MTTTLKLTPIIQLNDDQFYRLCQVNPDLRLELTASGELIMNPPTGGSTGEYNSNLNLDFGIWNRQTKLGKVFDSSTGFKLPNGATRSPDVAWISLERWNQLTPEQQEVFPPIAPDFVLELISPSDSLKEVQDKMKEYIENGVQLGWLISEVRADPGACIRENCDRKNRFVEIYRPQKAVEKLKMPVCLSGENILLGFSINL